MAGKKKNAIDAPVIPLEVKSEEKLMLQNGLQEALFGQQNAMFAGGSQLSQVDTLFKQSRWYLVSNMRQILSEIYVEHGIVQTIVDVPVDDGFRGGVRIATEQLEEGDLKKLHTEIEREDDMGVMKEASKWKRLFGGSAIVIITDQNPATPLNLEKLTEDSPLEFKAVDLWELYSENQMADYNDAKFKARPEDDFFMYYNKKLHKSRVIKMKGLKAPSFVRPRLRGWGFSVVEALIRSINQYLKATDLAFEVLDEHKIDVYKIKGLTQALVAPNGASKIFQRVQLANQQKNYQNAITMDAEDDYVQKELAFAGLSEIMDGIKKQIASDLRMPLTKVFGISAAGFSSGEDDIENYNAMVESTIRQPAKFDVVRMVEIRCQKMFGFIPDDLEIEFEPLRVLSSEQEENVKTQKFARLQQALQAGAISAQEFKQACNKENLFGIKIDETTELIKMAADENTEKPEGGAAGTKGKSQSPEASEAPEAKQTNSLGYEVAVYAQDTAGGLNTVPRWKKRLYDMNDALDKDLWARAKDAAKMSNEDSWQFVIWYYERHGGEYK